MMIPTTVAGSLPKPDWLAEPEMIWAPWRLEGEALAEGKRRAAREWIAHQRDAGIDIVSDGEQFRKHFVHGFLEEIEGIDWQKMTTMGIRNDRYDADVPTVTAAVRRPKPVHVEDAKYCRGLTDGKLKFTLPGPMTICDTIANGYYETRPEMAMAFAEVLNQEARELEAAGVDVIQFDEPAFNAFTEEAATWGVEALHKAIDGLTCTTAVHICYGYGIEANIEWKKTLGQRVAPVRGFLPGPERQPDRPGIAGMRQFAGAAVADRAVEGQGRAGGRHRRCDRDGRDAGAGRGDAAGGIRVRRSRADRCLHELRPGAAALCGGRGQAGGAGRGRGVVPEGVGGRVIPSPHRQSALRICTSGTGVPPRSSVRRSMGS